MSDEFPYANSPATKMLAAGLARAGDEYGRSVRQIGKDLGYKQAVVLSHMASGRVPIPIDRAEDFARELGLDPASFLGEVLKQRHPNVSWQLISGFSQQNGENDALSRELEAIIGQSLKTLTKEQRAIIREVAADPRPRRRWLTVHEIAVLELLRNRRPQLSIDGLPQEDFTALDKLLQGV